MSDEIPTLKARLEALRKLLKVTIWDLNTDVLTPSRRLGVVVLRVLSILKADYFRNNIALHAAGLTNITLMSFVPVLAFVVAIAKGVGVYARLIGPVDASLTDPDSPLPRGVAEMLKRLLELIQNTDISALGPLAVVFVLWTIVSVIGNIETTFNRIWGIPEGRDLVQRFKDYLLLVFLLPLAFGVTASLTTAMRLDSVTQLLQEHLGDAGLAISYMATMAVSVLLMALALTYMYRFLPNTQVRFLPAFLASVITTVAWIGLQRVYIHFQIGVASANGIYGAFATLPLFLTWLYISWLVTLMGAELTYALQCHRDYETDNPDLEPAPGVLLHALCVLYGDIAERFRRGDRWVLSDALVRLHLANRVVRRALHVLERADLIRAGAARDTYLPSENTHRITLADLQAAFDRAGIDPELVPAGAGREVLVALRAVQQEAAVRLAARTVTEK